MYRTASLPLASLPRPLLSLSLSPSSPSLSPSRSLSDMRYSPACLRWQVGIVSVSGFGDDDSLEIMDVNPRGTVAIVTCVLSVDAASHCGPLCVALVLRIDGVDALTPCCAALTLFGYNRLSLVGKTADLLFPEQLADVVGNAINGADTGVAAVRPCCRCVSSTPAVAASSPRSLCLHRCVRVVRPVSRTAGCCIHVNPAVNGLTGSVDPHHRIPLTLRWDVCRHTPPSGCTPPVTSCRCCSEPQLPTARACASSRS
jgi:hypothetical protein